MGFFDFLKENEPEIEEIEQRLKEGEEAKNEKKGFSFFKKKRSEPKSNENGPKEYETIDDIHKKKQKALSGLVIKAFFFSIVSLLVLSLLIVAYKSITGEKRVVQKKKEEKFEFNISKEDYWKLSTNKKINKLSQEIKGIKSEVKKELNETVVKINDTIADFQERMASQMEKIDNSLQTLDEKYQKNLEELKESIISYVESKNKETKNEISTTLQESLKNIKKEAVTIEKGAKALPIPKFDIPLTHLTQKKNNTVADTVTKKKTVLPETEKQIEEKYASLDLETLPTDSSIDYNKLYEIRNKENNNTEKEPPMHIMTGFAKATLITGVSASTFGEGIEHPKPVILSLDTPSVIANDDYENLQDCMLIGEANGNLNSSRAEIKITRISCSAIDKKGKKHKLEFAADPIGWVIGEDGKYGLKGRLVDSAGKIILRQIMVGFLQGVAMAFQPQPVYLANPVSPKGAAQGVESGIAGGVNTAFNSLAKYYQKMLEGMYPYIDVMAGRKVTVLFKGFQDVNFTRYTPIDVANIDSDYDGEDIEIEENDYALGF